ncbi:hypothetical protein Tco_1282833 [Tanacetum coccineum]
MPGLEHPPSPDYVHGPEYLEYLVPSDDEVPIEDQPLPADVSPTALSLGYVADSDPLEEDSKEDPAEYPTNGGDNNNDDDDDEEEDEEEEEHLAPTVSTTLHAVDPVPSAEDTEAFETDESAPTPTHTSPTYAKAPLGYRAAMIRSRAASPSPRLCRARISVRPQTPMSTATEALIDAVDAALPSSPPPSLLNPLSSLLPQIPSPPLPLPSPPLPLPTPSLPLLLPSIDCKDDIPKAYFPPQKRLCLTAPTPMFEMGESSTAAAARQAKRLMSREVGYEITDTWDELVDAIQQIAPTTLEGDDRALLRARVNMFVRDRRYHVHTTMLLESEARHARQAWSQAIDCNRAVHAELLAYQLTAALGRIHTLEARKPARTDDPKDANTQGVSTALTEYEANRGSGNGDDSHDSGSGRRTEQAARECTYNDFMKCQPLNFKGTEVVVGLTQWFEKIESVFHISNCIIVFQIKFATCTLLGNDLTWWDSYVKDCEIKKLEIELWNLKMKCTDVLSYNQRFQELALMCSRMFPEGSDEVKKYVSGLPDMI